MQGYRVRIGGPAVSLNPDLLAGIAEVGGEVDALPHHNSNATFTSRGCIRRCSFCAVPIIEGELRELPTWERKPIVCDNNLLACSRTHFDRVVDSLKGLSGVDFNQGLDARLLTQHHLERLTELNLLAVRFAWDHTASESAVMDAIQRTRVAGIPKSKINVYVLMGYDDTPDDATYRLEAIKAMGLMPFPMRYQPLNAVVKDAYVGEHWTKRGLERMIRYWSRQAWLGGIPYAEYRG
jgi:hypothetical protein